MNLNICKQCLHVKTVKFIVNASYNKDFGKLMYHITVGGFPIGENTCQLDNIWFEDKDELNEVIEKGKPESLVIISSSCPYYTEHLLTDWN